MLHDELCNRRSWHRRLCWDRSLPADLVEQLWNNPLSLLRAGCVLQEKPKCVVVRIDHSAGRFVLKHHSWGGMARSVRKSLRQSSAEKAFYDTRFLHATGVRTPQAFAFGQQQFGPFRSNSFLLTEYIEGTTLYRHMRFDRPPPERVSQMAQQVSQLWQQLDDLRVSHNDFKTENFQIDPEGRLWLIDLERMRRCRTRAKLRRKQAQDAATLLHPRNWRAQPAAAEIFRRKILETPAALALSPSNARHPLRGPRSAVNQPSHLFTVLIACHGSTDGIERSIESVRDFADEILVALSGANGVPRGLAAHRDCKFIARDDLDEFEFEQWAHGQAEHPWILRLSPHERLNAELGKQVQDCIAKEPAEDGFRIQRRFYHRGRALRFGCFRHDAPLRLFRRDAGRLAIHNGRMEMIVPREKVGSLAGKLMCEVGLNLAQEIDALNRLTTQSAQLAAADAEMVSWRRSYGLAALSSFLRAYFLQLGFLDGQAGLNAAWQLAFAKWLHHAKERECRQVSSTVAADAGRTLKLFDSGISRAHPSVADVAKTQQTQAAA